MSDKRATMTRWDSHRVRYVSLAFIARMISSIGSNDGLKSLRYANDRPPLEVSSIRIFPSEIIFSLSLSLFPFYIFSTNSERYLRRGSVRGRVVRAEMSVNAR